MSGGYAVSDRESIEPKHIVFNKMNENNTRYVCEGKHAVGASSAVFDGTDVFFDVGYMLAF